MTHKNPFEIRAEMLAMAKDYMDQQWSMNIQLANDMHEQGKKSMEEVKEAYKIDGKSQRNVCICLKKRLDNIYRLCYNI